MQIEELNSYSPADLQSLDVLMHELSATSTCTEAQLESVIAAPDSHLYVIRHEGQIIACACLCVAHSPEFTIGFVESVTVKREYRGRHLGKQLMEHLIAQAGRIGVHKLHLTSSPARVEANGLYQSLGFTRHETNCYQLEL